MCGIAGFSRNTERTSIPNGRNFAIQLAHTIQPRGKDATGFAWQEKHDDDNVWYSKNKGPAVRVARELALPSVGITNLLAHTRYLTLGSAEDNNNNHPVVADGITLTHNGRCENHDELIALTGVDRIGEVDSFAIAALLSQQEALGASHPMELLELIHGVASLAWLDAQDPGVLHLARLSTRPLTVGWTKKGDLVYSSTRGTLQAGSAKGGVKVNDIIDIPEGTYLRVRDGAFEEWSSFKVNHPKVAAPDTDVVGGPKQKRSKKQAKKARQLKLPSSITSFDPDTVEPPFILNHDEYLDSMGEPSDHDLLAGFDSWEENMRSRDGIDWDALVPRRGWK